jgi:predicted nucleic acid-binding Zn ribbon protein
MPKKQPQTVGKILEKLFAELGQTERYKRSTILGSWSEIVGEQIARVSTAERILGNRLFVRVTDSTWRHELSMRRRDIIHKVNTFIGKQIIDDIKFY